MAEAQNRISFTIHGSSTYRGKLAIRFKAPYHQATFCVLNGLHKDTNLDLWHEGAQQFIGLGDKIVDYNNNVLLGLRKQLDPIERHPDLTTSVMLKSAFTNGVPGQFNEDMTLGEWAKVRTLELRKANTGNYQVYNNLANKLQGVNDKTGEKFRPPYYEGKPLSSVKLSNMNTKHFQAFANWVLCSLNGVNFESLMKTLRALVRLGCKRFNIPYNNTYSYEDDIPDKQLVERKPTLTLEQIALIENFDIKSIAPPQRHFAWLYELYRDFVLFMYYTGMRPIDAMKMHSKREFNPNNKTITYLPHKNQSKAKKCKNVKPITIGLNAKALGIIKKYQGQSAGGYLLPFPMNDKDWGPISLNSSHDVWIEWRKQQNKTLFRINKALKTISERMNLGYEGLTTYVFRHTVITHKLKYDNMNIAVVAKMCGTSVKMIEETYLSNDYSDYTL